MPTLRLEEFVYARSKALRSVLRPDPMYYWRKLCRWACDALNISIFEAERMPLNVLLRHYYEARFEELEDEQIDKVLKMVLETKRETQAREEEGIQDEAETDEFAEMVRREAEALAKKRGEKLLTKEEATKALAAQTARPSVPTIPVIGQAPSQAAGAPPISLADLPPDVSVKFDDPEAESADWGVLGPSK